QLGHGAVLLRHSRTYRRHWNRSSGDGPVRLCGNLGEPGAQKRARRSASENHFADAEPGGDPALDSSIRTRHGHWLATRYSSRWRRAARIVRSVWAGEESFEATTGIWHGCR